MKYNLTTVSLTSKASQEVARQLEPLIGDYFTITCHAYKDFIKHRPPHDKLVLITAPVVAELVVEHLDADCKYFVAKRTINPRNIGKILDIPEGTDVLVVNNSHENVMEVISELKTIGINHLQYHPFIPEEPLRRDFRYALTPDEVQLVPEGIPHVVDIGSRFISLMTIAQIFYYCEECLLMENFLYERYIRDYVSLSMNLSRHIRQNIMLQKQMELILSNFEDGIIITEDDQRITFHNKTASSLLQDYELLGKYLSDTGIVIDTEYANDTTFINIEGKAIYVDSKHVVLSNNKPIHMITLKDMTTINKVDEQYKRQKKHSGYTAKFTFDDILHRSASMTRTVAIAKRLARNDSTILITGESGTGKELLAQSIHNASPRREFPFIAINCAALSETLLESELFGYEEGAFTGASKGGRRGLFELADKGTIFLDEIGDASPSIQNKMLRVLQEREIMRVSGSRIIPVNVRVIAATNKELQTLVERGAFRQDLYYRLNVLALRVPPLRERKEDIEMLFRHFLTARGGRASLLDRELAGRIEAYNWPGNIRELQNVVEYISTVLEAGINLKQDILQLFAAAPGPAPATRPAQARDPELLFRDPAIHAQLLSILGLLAQAKAQRRLMGRERLCALLREEGLGLTAQQVKTRLAMLRDQGFVESFTGKGTVITDAGLACLRGQA